MNILEKVQKIVSTVFCLHDGDKCDRFAQIANQFDKKDLEEVREYAEKNNMIEEAPKDKDNFLRGSLMSTDRRRHSQTMNKIAISYWRHGQGCSCCKESHTSEDFDRIAPKSIYNKGTCSDLARTGYIDLTNPGLGNELQNLTSFITESGRHRVLTQEFVDHVANAQSIIEQPKASDTLTRIAAQVRKIEDTIGELAQNPELLMNAIATEELELPQQSVTNVQEFAAINTPASECSTADLAPIEVGQPVHIQIHEPAQVESKVTDTQTDLPACEVPINVVEVKDATTLGRLIQKKVS